MTKLDDIKKAEDMDIIEGVFGFKFSEGGYIGMVNVYIEDDENFHWKFSVDKSWMPYLARGANKSLSPDLKNISKKLTERDKVNYNNMLTSINFTSSMLESWNKIVRLIKERKGKKIND